jgi:hypothetical protein
VHSFHESLIHCNSPLIPFETPETSVSFEPVSDSIEVRPLTIS